MNNMLELIGEIEDKRQQTKVRYPLKEIIISALFAMLGNANEWEEIEAFGRAHEDCLQEYLALKNGIPSHDTIRRVMGMLSSDSIQTVVAEKSNEITAIPLLLMAIAIKGQIVTIDAMGTQTGIAKQIKELKGDYVLALKGNQSILKTDVADYFKDKQFLEKIKKEGNYRKSVEKAHSRIETWNYYQTSDIKWLASREKWQGLKSIGMVEAVLQDGAQVTSDIRLYISNMPCDIALFERAVRGHWAIESMHWHLDVTFREDFNTTIDKTAALNLNIMRKFCLCVLKLLEVKKTKTSLKLKRYYICCNPGKYLEQILNL